MITRSNEFFKEWSLRTGISQKDLTEIYDNMCDILRESINSEEESITVLPKIGKFRVKVRKPYVGRNPGTNEKILIEASRRCHFTLNNSIKETLNK